MTKRILKRSLSVLLAFTMVLTTCVFAGMPLAGLFTPKAAAAPDDALKTHEDGSFTILQVADVQSTYPVPDQWLNALRLSIATAQPDLIVMTGDNVVNSNDLNAFKNTVDQITAEFYTLVTTKSGEGASATYSTEEIPIPFAVTFGNHDYEGCNNLALDTQWAYYLSKGAIDFQKACDGQAVPKGTGYIDIWNADGTAIVQRVIILNSGSYEGGGYARPGLSQEGNANYYSEVVTAVNSWTSDSNIKCIGFQHIPMQEFYLGDSASTSILKSSTGAGALPAYGTASGSGISGSYAPNTENPTVTGQYTEQCCCSYNSTRDLYNAYAKDNVYGVFYGHDHGNLINGVSTVGGKKLHHGYGGGLNTEWNGSHTSLFSHYELNSAYTGPDDTANFKKEGFNYASYLEALDGVYGPKTYTPAGLNYITELFAEMAPLNWTQTRSFQRAYDNVRVKADYCLNDMANDPNSRADLQKGTGADYVALGYDLTTDRTKAVTGIIGMQVTGTHQPTITVNLQDNTPVTYYLEDNNCNCASGSGDFANLIYYTTDPKAGPPITNIYMTYENGGGLYGHYGRGADSVSKPYKVSFTVAETGTSGVYQLQDWNAFDFNRGCGSSTPYIYLAYASNGTVDVTRAYYDLLVAFYKYGHVQDSSHQVYDSLTYDPYNEYRNQVDNFLNNPSTGVSVTPYSEQPYEQINKMTKVLVDAYNALKFKPEDNGKQVTSDDPAYTDFHVAVPDTIYLKPGDSSQADCYCNNKIDANGEIVPDGTASTTGTFEIVCKDAYDVQIAVRRMKPMSSGQRFQFSETKAAPNYYAFDTTSGHPNALYVTAQSTATDHGEFISGAYDGNTHSYSISGGDGGAGHENFPKMKPAVRADGTEYIKGEITTFSMETASALLAAGDTQMLEWQFTITRGNGTTAEVYAYSVIYAPCVYPVAASVSVSGNGAGSTNNTYLHGSVTAVISGVNGISSNTSSSIYVGSTKISTSSQDGTGSYNPSSTYPILNSGYTVPTWAPGVPGFNNTSGSGHAFWYAGRTNKSDSGGTHTVIGGTGYIGFDVSRYRTLGQIPYFQIRNDMHGLTKVDATLKAGIADDTYSGNYYILKGDNIAAASTSIEKTNGVGTNGQYSGVSAQIANTLSNEANALVYTDTERNSGTYARKYVVCFGQFVVRNSSGIGGGSSATGKSYAVCEINGADKSIIRKAVGKYESLSPQKEWLLDDKVSLYTTYMNALINASYALGDPAYGDVTLNVETNYTTPLAAAFSAMGGTNQKRSCVINGVTVPYFTTEINYGLKGNLDGFGHRSDYTVDPTIVDLYRYQGPDTDGNGEGDGIYSLNTIYVKPYDFCADYGYNYVGWMDGEGFQDRFAVDSTHWSGITNGYLPQAGDIVTDNMLLNFYTDFDGVTDSAGEHPTADPVNYGHITAEMIIEKYNLFHFYYKKTDHRLTFDVGAGQFTYSDGSTKTGTQYSTVAAQDDSFQIGFIPTRSGGYLFDGWKLTSGDGNYDSATNTYTFGTSDATLTAIWVKQSWLYVDSDGGYTKNNLIYFNEARDTTNFSTANLTGTASYEDDSDVTISGTITATGNEITPQLDNKMFVYLTEGHTYQISFDCTNHNMDFYAYKVGTGMGTRSGRLKNYALDSHGNYIQNEDGTYTATTTFTVGGTGTDASDRTWNNASYAGQLTAEYNFRISVAKTQPTDTYTIKNLRIIEVNPGDVTDIDPAQQGWDNKIYQLEGRTRNLPNPDDRPDGYIFGGWEVYEMNGTSFGTKIGNTMDQPDILTNYIYQNTMGGYSFVYQNRDIGLKVMWIKPIGAALDNLFNFYEFRYNPCSRVLVNKKTNDDVIIFDNVNQTIRIKEDGSPNGTGDDAYDIYTGHGKVGENMPCEMPLFVDKDNNKVRTYLLTMDVSVSAGNARFLVFGHKTAADGSTDRAQSSSWILTQESLTSSKHVCTLFTVSDDTDYIRIRFGTNVKSSDITYSNIRIVPVNSVNTTDSSDASYIAKGSALKYTENKAKVSSIIDEDTLGYAYDNSTALDEADRIDPKIDPVTRTYNMLEQESLGNDLYAPERYGYAFVGWVKDGLYVADPDDQKSFFQRSTPVTTDVNIWSRWSPDEFILKYDANTTDTVTDMPVNANPSTTETSITWTLIFDSATKAASDDIISKAVPIDSTASDTLFMGWCTVPSPTTENPGEMFYPGGDLPRKTVDALYGKKNGDNNVLTLYAQWFNTKPAKDDAAKNNKDGELEQLKTNIVRGVELNADGTVKDELLYEMKDATNRVELTKFDEGLHGAYETAIANMNNAFTAYNTDGVDADTTADIKQYCGEVVATATNLKAESVIVEGVTVKTQNKVDDTYNNSFIIKDSTGAEKTHTLADMNLNHYATDTLTDASTAKTNGNTAAYSSGTTLRKAFDSVTIGGTSTTAQIALNDAVGKMARDFATKTKLNVQPTYQVFETPQAVANALEVSPDVNGVNYVFSSYSGYTYYCYTNKPNPKIAISVDELDPNSTGRVCYPTTAAKATGSADASINKVSVTNTTYDAYLQNGLGTSMTDLNENYYKQKTVITMQPSFTTDKQEVVYKFTAHDDAYAGASGTDYNYAENAALTGGLTSNKYGVNENAASNIDTIAKRRTTDSKNPENGISIVVCYKPKGTFSVYTDENIQWGDHDLWLNKVHLYRSAGGASNSQMVDRIGGATGSHEEYYTVVDPDFGQSNYGSFLYVFDNGTDSTENCTINLSGCTTKEQKIEKVKQFFGKQSGYGVKANTANFEAAYTKGFSQKNTGGTGLGYLRWLGSEWSIGFYPKGNAYVYVHLVDRWGNVAEDLYVLPGLDYNPAKGDTASAGSAVITEDGGSGIDTASINAKSIQIITDDESELNGNVYTTKGNTVKIYTGEPNKSYTLTLTDNATNKSTVTVKTDADGYLLMKFEDTAYTSGVYSFTLNDFEINLYAGVEPAAKGKVVDVQYEAAVGQTNTYSVKVEDRANMLQFIESDHGDGTGTRSFGRYDDRVTIVSYDKDGNVVNSTSKDLAYEIWTVETQLADGNIDVRVKESGSNAWEDMSFAYRFENEYAEANSDLISAELAKTEGAKGGIGFTVVAGADVKSVQLKNEEGETTTISASKATVNEDGTLTFTGKVWFHGTGTRTATVRILDAYGWKDAGTLTYEINK